MREIYNLTRKCFKSRYRYGEKRQANGKQWFECANCHAVISVNPEISGVQNRNHCPHCLWSRHMDLHAAGDRLSACKARMRPIGLVLKAVHKKYGRNGGELMLIHVCEECSALSVNRIAADDDPERLVLAFEGSLLLEESIRQRLEGSRIKLLQKTEVGLVAQRLFGIETNQNAQERHVNLDD